MTKICITGASGFIGSNVSKYLLQKNCDVIPVIRSSVNIKSDILKYKVLDIKVPKMKVYDELNKPDILIHLAWSNLDNYASDLHITEEYPKHFEFLKKLIDSGLKNLVVAGTCFEYGLKNGLLKENDEVNPNNAYSKAKLMMYENLLKLKQNKDFNLIWLRIFYLFGDGQKENSLWTQLNMKVKNNEKFFPMTSGEQIRDFLDIKIASKYISELSLLKKDFGVINICSNQPISVKNLVEKWIKKNNWKIKPKYNSVGKSIYESENFWGDNTKLIQSLKTC